jgi:hypothetical protein
LLHREASKDTNKDGFKGLLITESDLEPGKRWGALDQSRGKSSAEGFDPGDVSASASGRHELT